MYTLEQNVSISYQTGSAAVRAPVNCFAAPEYKEDTVQQESTLQQSPFNELSQMLPTETDLLNSTQILSVERNSKETKRNSLGSSNVVHVESSRRHSTSSLHSVRTNNTVSTLPKWRPAGSTSCNSLPSNTSNCKSDGSSCIPRPADLRVTRRVGVDGVVLAWSPLDHDCIAGFQVVVAGKVVQQVKSPHRTKALITGLSMTTPCTIGLISVGIDGRCSKPAVVTCDRSSVYLKSSVRRGVTPSTRRMTAVPTNM